MKQQTKYLALFLIVVFTLPKIYQDIHILNHHAAYISVKTDQKNIAEVSKSKTGVCIICNFEFAFSNVPFTFFYQLFIGLVLIFFIRPVSGENKKFTGYSFSLRAPPAYF